MCQVCQYPDKKKSFKRLYFVKWLTFTAFYGIVLATIDWKQMVAGFLYKFFFFIFMLICWSLGGAAWLIPLTSYKHLRAAQICVEIETFIMMFITVLGVVYFTDDNNHTQVLGTFIGVFYLYTLIIYCLNNDNFKKIRAAFKVEQIQQARLGTYSPTIAKSPTSVQSSVKNTLIEEMKTSEIKLEVKRLKELKNQDNLQANVKRKLLKQLKQTEEQLEIKRLQEQINSNLKQLNSPPQEQPLLQQNRNPSIQIDDSSKVEDYDVEIGLPVDQ